MTSLENSRTGAKRFDVAIIGYGPVGATLANLLGRRGIETLVIERDAGPYSLPRAVHFDDEVMRVFQGVGLADAIAPSLRVSPGMHFVDADGRLLLDWSRPVAIGPLGWHQSYRFHQPDLEAALRLGVAALPSVELRQRCEAYALDEDGGGVTIRYENLADGSLGRARARYVVGCDGARSLLRRLIGSDLEDLGFHERWLVVDLILKREMPELGDYSIQHCDPARPATYVRGAGLRRRWEITALPGESNAALTEPAKVWELLARWITPQDAQIERAAVYSFHSTIAERWRAGRLLIAGDCAHQTPPFLGQGMCAGIRDVANLAWKLEAVLNGRSDETLLDSYQSERAPHVREYIELAVRLGGLINTKAMATALGRPAGETDAPMRMQTTKPRLGPGLGLDHGDLIGRLAPQPCLANGRRHDDALGDGFAWLLRRGALDLAGPLRRRLAAHGVAAVETAAPDLDAWLDQAGVAAVLVRPDRYVMATALDAFAIEALLDAFPLSPAAPQTILPSILQRAMTA